MELGPQPKNEPLLPRAPGSPAAGRPLPEGPVRVLLADDDTDTLVTLATLLQAEGFDVKMVLNGKPVLAVVGYYKPHVVILDIGMPDCTGHSLAMELSACYGDKCPVLVALTGRAAESDRLQSRRSGFHYHITKPYDPIQLLGLLTSLRARQ